MPSFRLVETRADFLALAPHWNALAAVDDRPGAAFRSFAWHRAWLDHFGPGDADQKSRLAIVVGSMSDQDDLPPDLPIDIIVPLLRQRAGGLTRLSLMGDPVSQYGDVIAKPVQAGTQGSTTDLSGAIEAALNFAAEQTGADILSLSRVRGDALLAPFVERQRSWCTQRLAAPYIEIAAYRSVDEFLATQSKSTRKQRKRLRRRLDEQAPVRFDFRFPGRKARTVTKRIIDLKTQTLAEKGILSRAFSDPRVAAFFADVTDAGSGVDARVSTFVSEPTGSSSETLIAADIGFREGTRLVAHIGVFDPAYHKFAAGHLLQEDVMRACLAEGITTYDFLAPADDYKRGWANASMDVCDYAISFTTAGRLHREVIQKRALPALKWGQQNLPRPLKQVVARLLSWKLSRGEGSTAVSVKMMLMLTGG